MKDLEVIIKGCINLDSKSQEKLYNYYHYKLLRVAGSILKDDALGKDIVQDSFLKIFDKLHTLDNFHPDVVSRWCTLVVKHKCIDYLRKKRSVRINLDCDHWTSFFKLAEDEVDEVDDTTYLERKGVTMTEINKAINRLPPQYNKVFTSYYLDGLTHKEIGEELGICIGSSKSSLSRAKKILIKQLT